MECTGFWTSCIGSNESECRITDPAFEGMMLIGLVNPDTGFFTGSFFPKDGSPPQEIHGQCSDSQPHLKIFRNTEEYYYRGDKSGKHVKGKRKKLKVVDEKGERNFKLDDDEWTGTHTT